MLHIFAHVNVISKNNYGNRVHIKWFDRTSNMEEIDDMLFKFYLHKLLK